MKTRSILKQTVNCPLIPPDPGASLTARRLYCAFHKHANSKVQKPPSQLCLSLPSIIITIKSNETWNRETHKTDRNPQITNHDLLNQWSRVLGAIHFTILSGKFGPKLNGSVRSNRKSFEKTGPPFEVVLFFRSDRSEFWSNGSRPWSHQGANSKMQY